MAPSNVEQRRWNECLRCGQAVLSLPPEQPPSPRAKPGRAARPSTARGGKEISPLAVLSWPTKAGPEGVSSNRWKS
jgi:hypothetical protein